jgi:nicotinate-nucleotide adenylyltransferase
VEVYPVFRHTLPFAPEAARIGLFGGSFDPPHAGHLHISREALKRLRLDQVWWLVSPGNPLKSRGPAPLDARINAARALQAGHPKLRVTGIEAQLGTRFTAQTLRQMQALYPKLRFVWMMGADNLAQFHLWQDWQEIISSLPIAVFARPQAGLPARFSKAARAFDAARVAPELAYSLADYEAPAWTYLTLPLRSESSSQLRAAGVWS